LNRETKTDQENKMTHRNVRCVVAALAWIAAAVPLSAQSDMRGHWNGSIETPGGALAMEVDLDMAASGWIGSVSIPAQGATGMPLDAISFHDGKGSFHFKGVPGDPTFAGTLSQDGKILEGNFSQGGASLPLKLTRTGEAKVETVRPSPAIAPEFVGTWEGTIQAGPGLRIVLTISNGRAGAEAQMVSVDQGNAQIPVSAIIQTGAKLTLEVKAAGGGYDGEINKEGTELNGTWTQLGNSVALQLKKSAKP
jgi:uncharacterized protein